MNFQGNDERREHPSPSLTQYIYTSTCCQRKNDERRGKKYGRRREDAIGMKERGSRRS